MKKEFNFIIKNNKNIKYIINKINKIISLPSSKIGNDYYKNHLLPTAYYSYLLANKIKEDVEVYIIAGLVHDIARYKAKRIHKHEYYSAVIVEKWLKEINYPKNKIELIKININNHREGKEINGNYKYKIISDADVISFIKHIDFFINFERKNGSDIYKWLKLKKQQMYDKISILALKKFKKIFKKLEKVIKMEENKKYLGKNVTVKMDRVLGTKHSKYNWIYSLNYGFIPNTVSGDGEEVDAYVVGIFEPVEEFTGNVIAIIHRTNDDDDKLIVAPEGVNYTDDQIRALTEFQEKWFESIIIRE